MVLGADENGEVVSLVRKSGCWSALALSVVLVGVSNLAVAEEVRTGGDGTVATPLAVHDTVVGGFNVKEECWVRAL